MRSVESLTAFRQYQAWRHFSERTITGRARLLTNLAHFLGRDPVDSSTKELERWLASCSLGARSKAMYLSVLRAYFRWAVDDGRRKDNPALKIPSPRLPRTIPRPIATKDLELALSRADPRMKAWLTLGCYAGFRCVEISRLDRDHVLEGHDPPLLLVLNGKGGHQRAIPLNLNVEKALRNYGLPNRGPLFRLNNGRPIQAQTVSYYINHFLHSLGIASTAHRLRSWFATTLHARTKDLPLVSELLGHASLKTTSLYVAFSPSQAAEVVRNLSLS